MKVLKLCVLPAILMLVLCACRPQGPTWQEQYDLGVRYLSEGNYEEAIIAFTAAIEVDPEQAPAFMQRAIASIYLGETGDNLAAAQADYERAIVLDETLVEAYLGLAGVYVLCGDYDSAITVLQNGFDKTENEQLFTQIRLYRQEMLPDEVTVLTQQYAKKYDFVYDDFDGYSESKDIYKYDEDGYMIHRESWYCPHSAWESNGEEWVETSSEDWMLDYERQTCTESVFRRYPDESKSEYQVDWPQVGTHRFSMGSDGDVCMTFDPYPDEMMAIVYNPDYGDTGSAHDWYSAEYTYDDAGNAVLIKSYGEDGKLYGICELEYETIYPVRKKSR